MFNAHPALQEIVDSWSKLDGSTDRCNRDKAEAAVQLLYKNGKLAPPIIKWWSSPIAMFLAHEIHCMGMVNARAHYKDAVFSVSPELNEWLSDPMSERLIIGRPIGKNSCSCANSAIGGKEAFKKKKLLYPKFNPHESHLDTIERAVWPKMRDFVLRAGRTSALNCPKLTSMLDSVRTNELFQSANILLSTAFPGGAFSFNREIDGRVFDAFMQGLEDPGISDDERMNWWPRAVFTKNASLLETDLASDLVKWQFTTALANKSLGDSCLSPYIDLIQNSHTAIIRENICWLSDRPVILEFKADRSLNTGGKPAICYADGTELYVNNGHLLPAKWVKAPENISLDFIDGNTIPSFRRQQLIELFGIEQYLAARSAIKAEESLDGILWELTAGSHGLIRIIETPDFKFDEQPTSKTFQQLPENILTLRAALEFLEDELSDCLIITVDTESPLFLQ